METHALASLHNLELDCASGPVVGGVGGDAIGGGHQVKNSVWRDMWSYAERSPLNGESWTLTPLSFLSLSLSLSPSLDWVVCWLVTSNQLRGEGVPFPLYFVWRWELAHPMGGGEREGQWARIHVSRCWALYFSLL